MSCTRISEGRPVGYGHIDPTRLIYASVAQLVEQLAFNQLAGGSSPFRRTTKYHDD